MTNLVELTDIWIEGRSDETWNPIINGASLGLKKGEVLGLIGESGAGKSTLGLAAMGFARDGVRISKGSVTFDGIDLINASAAVKRDLLGKRIAYVAQSAAASFNPAHRLIDQHVEGPVQHSVSSRLDGVKDGVELYRRLRLPSPDEIGFRYPHQVSGGQLQRAMTAMAMSCRPDLIIFDEPTTALDVTTQIEVLASIRDIVEQFDTAAIYITHDLAVVAQMADRIKVLLKGDEVEESDTRKMLSDPSEEYTKSLWAVRSFQRPEKSAIPKDSVPVFALTTSPPPMAKRSFCMMSALTFIPVARLRSWASPAPANRPPRAASPVCCRRARVSWNSMAKKCRSTIANGQKCSCVRHR